MVLGKFKESHQKQCKKFKESQKMATFQKVKNVWKTLFELCWIAWKMATYFYYHLFITSHFRMTNKIGNYHFVWLQWPVCCLESSKIYFRFHTETCMHDIAIKKAYVVLGKFKESHQKQCKKFKESQKMATFPESQKRVDLPLNFVKLHGRWLHTFITICLLHLTFEWLIR